MYMNESIAKFVGGLIGVGGGGVIWVGGGGWGGHFNWYAARGLKKVPAIYEDFDFFFPKNPRF